MRAVVVALAAASLFGCTYRVAQLPAPGDFARSHAELVARFPDLDAVFPLYSSEGRWGMARAEEFVTAWGEPVHEEWSWWTLWPGNWAMAPQYLWTWELGGKLVRCRIDHPIYDGFEPTVCNCEYLDGV